MKPSKRGRATAPSRIKRSPKPALLSSPAQILALHGFTGCGEDFAEFSPFCGPDLRWHHPDLPGHAASAADQCDPAATLQRVDAWARALPEGPRILLGYSMGARAALLHALEYSDFWDALILIGANPGITDPVERQARRESDELIARRIEALGTEDFLEWWSAQPVINSQARIDPSIQARRLRLRLRHRPEGLARSLRDFGQGACPDLWHELPKLKCPALLITGSEDGKYSRIADRIAAMLPHAHCRRIPDSGHCPHLEAPTATARIVDAFIAEARNRD